jgi:3-dehydroquinate dehydratase-2
VTGPRVLLVSGPNLNLLGEREPGVYGTATLQEHLSTARDAAEQHGIELEHLQSNHEGELIEAVHRARGRCQAIVINAGALTHYAWALADALAAFDGVVVELHLSNPNAREPWRHTSVISPVADGCITGFGGVGYVLAIEAVARLLEHRPFATGEVPAPAPLEWPSQNLQPRIDVGDKDAR